MEDFDVRLHEAFGRTAASKLAALQSLRSELIEDHSTEKEKQKNVTASSIAFISRFAEDVDDAVAVSACRFFRDLLLPGSDSAKRLAYGQGLHQSHFNVLQTRVFKNKIVFRSLTTALHCGSPMREEAAEQALLAACMYNRPNTTKYVRHLISQIIANTSGHVWSKLAAALEHLPRLRQDEIEVEIDQILMPAMWVIQGIRGSGSEEQAAVMEVLGMVVEKRPAAKDFIILKGGLQRVAKLLVEGDMPVKDAAAHLLNLLLVGNSQLLPSYETLLGQPRDKLVAALGMVVRSSETPTLQWVRSPVTAPQALVDPTASMFDKPGFEAHHEYECVNGDDARELLRALASVDVLVQWKEDEEIVASATKCLIM